MPTKIDRCLAAIKTQCRILKENKIPFIFSAKPGKNDFTVGSKLCLDALDANKIQFQEAFVGDIRRMCDPARPVDGPEEDDDDIDQERLLKTPLSLANYKEVLCYVRYLIVKDRKIRLPDSNNKQIKYGEKSWEPSFWPNDMLVWCENHKNFSNIRTRDFTGKLSILDVLREAVKRGLVASGVDPENYYDKTNFTKEMEMKRKRNRGLHVHPEILDDENSDRDPVDPDSDESGRSFRPRRPTFYRTNRGPSPNDTFEDNDPYAAPPHVPDQDQMDGNNSDGHSNRNDAFERNDPYVAPPAISQTAIPPLVSEHNSELDGLSAEESRIENDDVDTPVSLQSTSSDNINTPRRPHLISQLAGLPSHDSVETDELGVDEFLANIRALEQTDANGNEDKQTSSPVESRSCLSKSDLSSESSSSCLPRSGSSLSSFNSEESQNTLVIRKSSRIRKTKVIFDNSEVNPQKRRKTVLSQTLENLLQVPSLSEKRRETKRKRRKHKETNNAA